MVFSLVRNSRFENSKLKLNDSILCIVSIPNFRMQQQVEHDSSRSWWMIFNGVFSQFPSPMATKVSNFISIQITSRRRQQKIQSYQRRYTYSLYVGIYFPCLFVSQYYFTVISIFYRVDFTYFFQSNWELNKISVDRDIDFSMPTHLWKRRFHLTELVNGSRLNGCLIVFLHIRRVEHEFLQ